MITWRFWKTALSKCRTVEIRSEASTMAKVEIYTSPWCGYCFSAKRLLDKKGVSYTEYDVTMDPAKRHEMLERSNGGRSVPQIFIDDRPIGGCDQLFELDLDDELNPLLGMEE
jgi:glutaredoxin 3